MLAVLVVGATACGSADSGQADVDPAGAVFAPDAGFDTAFGDLTPHGITVVVHRTAECECCGAYEAYLTDAGFEVVRELHDDLVPVKDALGVPPRERSCHTNEIAGYGAEGHLPVEALLALVANTPSVDGISLAGMPPGSPGMPGEQQNPFTVNAFVDGEVVGVFGEF